MSAVRINISLSRPIYEELTKEIEVRGRSRFISEAIDNALRERRNRRLASEYQEAAAEIKRIHADLEGTVADGID